MSDRQFAIGVDYGTNSVRALVVDVENGQEIGTCVFNYPSGKDGIILDDRDANFARQNPRDYVDGMEASVKGAIQAAMETPGFTRAMSSGSASIQPAVPRYL
jgi:L-ribulokinase